MRPTSDLAHAIRQVLMLSAMSAAASSAAAFAAAAGDKSSGDELQEIVVTGQQFEYGTLEGGNKMLTSVVDTPQSVQIITDDLIKFADLTNFNDIYKLDAGSQPSYSRAGLTWTYFRGFANSFEDALRVDGFRQFGSIIGDMAPYDRIEILRGSVATTYGQSGIAGTINAVTKQPRSDFGGSLSVEAGQWDHYRVDGDVYGPLTDDEALTGRFVGAYLNEKSSFDTWYDKRVVLAPSLKYAFNDNTSVLVQLTYEKLDSSASVGFPVAFNASGPGGSSNSANYSIPAVPLNEFGVGAPWSKIGKKLYEATVRVEHTFLENWHTRVNMEYTHLASDPLEWVWVGAYNTIPSNKKSVTNIYTYFGEENDATYSGEVDLFGDVELFGHKQTFFLDVDGERLKYSYAPYAGGFLSGQSTGFNIYNPNWSLIPAALSGSYSAFAPGGLYGPNGGLVYDFKRFQDNTGATAQAILRPWDPLTVNLGVRVSKSEEIASTRCCTYETHLQPYPAYTDYYPAQGATTFQGGVVYTLSKAINAYATWGQTFDVNNDFAYDPSDPNGRFLGPIKGITYEVGLKGELNSKRVYWALDAFDTVKTNVDQTDPLHPRFVIPVGEQRARGVEFEFQGKIAPGLDIFVSSAAMINKYIGGAYAGIESPFAPRFSISTYGSYQIQGGLLRGLGFGGGIVHQHRPEFQLLNGQLFPQFFGNFTTVDVKAFYDMGPWRFQLGATNLFDQRFFSPTFISLGEQIAVNPPRQWLGQVTRKF
jgi:TonB-dependent siderophore receptor